MHCSAAFHEKDVLLISPRQQYKPKVPLWTNLNSCRSRGIDVTSHYPNCAYLFRCLSSPHGDPLAFKVQTASLITKSTKLEEIARFFNDLNLALKAVDTTQAAQVLRPLREEAIFPITHGFSKIKDGQFDELLDLTDTSWYIANQSSTWDSFYGKIPLLALPVDVVTSIGDLLSVLRLEGRQLSKIVTSRTRPRGQVTVHWPYTSFLREKARFIKRYVTSPREPSPYIIIPSNNFIHHIVLHHSLIPDANPDRTTISRQLDEIRVNVATLVAQSFTLSLPGKGLIVGSEVPGDACLAKNGCLLTLSMTQDCIESKTPPYQLVKLMADYCSIKDSGHFSLLYMVLSDLSIENLSSLFCQHGLRVTGQTFSRCILLFISERFVRLAFALD